MTSLTTNTGKIGELAITIHLIELGYEVYSGVTGAESTDLLAYKNGNFTRLQVKCRVVKNGSVSFKRISGGYRKGTVLKGNEFDVMAVYLRDKQLCLFMNIKELLENDSTVTVRIETAKNGAKKNIRSYENYMSFDKASQT